MKKCSICGKKFNGYGNNPYPIVKNPNAVCCDECNIKVVVARLELLKQNINKENTNDYR